MAKPSNIKFPLLLQMARDPKLAAWDLRVGIALTVRCNLVKLRAWPSITCIANDLDRDPETTRRIISRSLMKLEERAHWKRSYRPRQTTLYLPVLHPDEEIDAATSETGVTDSAVKEDNSDRGRLTSESALDDTQVPKTVTALSPGIGKEKEKKNARAELALVAPDRTPTEEALHSLRLRTMKQLRHTATSVVDWLEWFEAASKVVSFPRTQRLLDQAQETHGQSNWMPFLLEQVPLPKKERK